MSLPPEGGVVDAAVYARPPSRRRRPQPIEEGRPESTDESFEKENPTSSSAVMNLNLVRARDVERCGEDEALGGRDAASSSEPRWRALDDVKKKGTQIGGSGPRGTSGGEG